MEEVVCAVLGGEPAANLVVGRGEVATVGPIVQLVDLDSAVVPQHARNDGACGSHWLGELARGLVDAEEVAVELQDARDEDGGLRSGRRGVLGESQLEDVERLHGEAQVARRAAIAGHTTFCNPLRRCPARVWKGVGGWGVDS